MSNIELPDQVNPYQLADKAADLAGHISPARLHRLGEATLKVNDGVQAELKFDHDSSGRRVITGQCSGSVDVQCQRCLKAFGQQLQGSFNLALTYNDEMSKALPEHLDALLILPDAPLDVASIIEDELLLCLPMHAVHPEGECSIETQFGSEESDLPSEKAPSPFDVLKDLK